MSPIRILIHRVLCDSLPDHVGELGDGAAQHHVGLLQTIEVRLTYPVYSMARHGDPERLSSWTSRDSIEGRTLSECVVMLCRHHYGQLAGQYAGEAMRGMASPMDQFTVGERGAW